MRTPPAALSPTALCLPWWWHLLHRRHGGDVERLVSAHAHVHTGPLHYGQTPINEARLMRLAMVPVQIAGVKVQPVLVGVTVYIPEPR